MPRSQPQGNYRYDVTVQKSTRKVGLARVLSKLGYCSRSRAAELIRSGEVAVNGTVRRDPEYPVSMEKDKLEVNGRPVKAGKKIYLVLNKPRGVVTTASDEQGRQTVYDLLDEHEGWVGPVGRLDKASEGLLLLTNDSEWGARVAAPETHLDKTYHVRVESQVDDSILQSLLNGVTSDGELLRAKSARKLRGGTRRVWIEIVLDEGKNRQIRRMLDALNIEVVRLVRVSIGPLALGDLPKGQSRELTRAEKAALDDAMREASTPRQLKPGRRPKLLSRT